MNVGRNTLGIFVANTGDQPIQVGSLYNPVHFITGTE
nr:urease subunit beta [Microcystis sp. M113S1]